MFLLVKYTEMNRNILATLSEAIEEINESNYDHNQDLVSEIVPFCKISTPGNQVKLRYFRSIMTYMHLTRKMWMKALVWLEV